MSRYDDYDDYDRFDDSERYADYDDPADDVRGEIVSEIIRSDFEAGEAIGLALEDEQVSEDDFPHPWTWARHLAALWFEGEDVLEEYLSDFYSDEIESALDDWRYNNQGPCCNNFDCPCGNSNNYRG